jgi:hypothetical protein
VKPPRALLGLPRTVVVLGLVSLANDAASEMMTPLLPVFLTATLGAGPAVVGLVEGVAESTASVLKVVSGRLADRGVGARRLVLAGYGASAFARPAIGLALGWAWVLAMRFIDRVGRGIRTAPRDALIAAAVPSSSLGRAFGFHRAMDHAGAVLGPLAAFALLAAGADIGQVFAWSLLPGLVVLALIGLGVPADEPAPRAPPSIRLAALDRRLKVMLLAAGMLALAALPEAFMVLWATGAGLPIAFVPLVWALASLAKMGIAVPAGLASDRLGRIPVLLAGWASRVVLLLLLAAAEPDGAWVWLLFVAYAASLSVTEAAERSLIGEAAPPGLVGTAFGAYHLVSGLFVLPGALALGLVWERFGSAPAFLAAAAITATAAVAMMLAGRGGGATGRR